MLIKRSIVNKLYRLKQGKKIGKWQEKGDTDDISLTSEEEPILEWVIGPDELKSLKITYPWMAAEEEPEEEQEEALPEDEIKGHQALLYDEKTGKWIPLGDITGKSYPTYLDEVEITANDPTKSYLERIGTKLVQETHSSDNPLPWPSLEEMDNTMIPLMLDACLMFLPVGNVARAGKFAANGAMKFLASPIGRRLINVGSKVWKPTNYGLEGLMYTFAPGHLVSGAMRLGRMLYGKAYKALPSWGLRILPRYTYTPGWNTAEQVVRGSLNGGYFVGEDVDVIRKIEKGEPLSFWDYFTLGYTIPAVKEGVGAVRMVLGANKFWPIAGAAAGAASSIYGDYKTRKEEEEAEEAERWYNILMTNGLTGDGTPLEMEDNGSVQEFINNYSTQK